MYKAAFKNQFYPNRVIIEGIDRAEIIDPGNVKDWAYNHAYCYELITFPQSRAEILKQFREDLVNFFGITAAVEKRNMKCLVIEKRNNNPVSKSPFSAALRGRVYEANDIKTVVDLAYVLDLKTPLHVLDETGDSAKLKVGLTDTLVSLSQIKAELNKNGYDLKEAMREIDVFVMRKIK